MRHTVWAYFFTTQNTFIIYFIITSIMHVLLSQMQQTFQINRLRIRTEGGANRKRDPVRNKVVDVGNSSTPVNGHLFSAGGHPVVIS